MKIDALIEWKEFTSEIINDRLDDLLASIKEALKKVASDDQARRNQVKKRNLHCVNEHFEPDFNAA